MVNEDMATNLSPDMLQALFALRDSLRAAQHGAATTLVHDFATRVGKNPNTVYTWLKQHAGYTTGRNRRSDCGTTSLPEDTLKFIAAAKREGIRGNGKATLPTSVAMNIAHENGIDVTVSEGRVNAIMRQRSLDAKTVQNARNHVSMRSLHPNHVHQIDPSLCLIYYTPKGQAIMRDEEFYKNKPASMDKVRMKVWRYVRYDHASGSVDVRYYEAEGENQRSLFEFLMYTWGQQPDRLSHGVPKLLLWDKGSANTSAAIRNLLDALGVDHRTHAAGHSWAKGGVEQANNLVETHFESRLRFEPVDTVEQLNQSSSRWVRDYNANLITHVDARLTRESGEPMVRDDLWQLIMRFPGALVTMPERQVCQWFLHGKEDTRLVRNSKITFVHPELGRSATYNLSGWAEFLGNGKSVTVKPLLLQDGSIRVQIDRFGDEPLLVQVQPNKDFDDFGREASGPVIGEAYARPAQTLHEVAAKSLVEAAYGKGTTIDQADELRAKQTKPFAHLNDGKGIVAHSHLGEAEAPTRIKPEATPLQTPELASLRKVQIMLTVPEAVRSIKDRLGEQAPADLYAQIKAAFPQGNVPNEWADNWGAAPAATGTNDGHAGAGLRRIK
jgi:transposase InsO family protein